MLSRARQTDVLVLLSFLDFLAVSMVIPQLGLRIRELGASQFTSGLISSVYGAVQLFSSTLHGMGCDKYGRRPVLLTCLFFITNSYICLSLSTTFLSMVMIRCTLGLVKHTQSTFKVIGGDINTGDARSSFVSRTNTLSGLAFMIGPFLTASLFDSETSFMYGGVVCSCIFVSMSLISYICVEESLTDAPQLVKENTTKPSNFSFLASIVQRFQKYKNLRAIFIYRFCAAFSVIILRYFTPLYTQHYFGFNAKDTNYLSSFNGFSGVLCSWAAGYVALVVADKATLLRYFAILLIIAIASTLLSTSMPAFLITQFLLSFATQNLRLIVDSVLLSAAANADRGEVFGLGASIIGMCRVCGPIFAGTLAEIHMMLPLVCSLFLAVLGAASLYTAEKQR